MLDGLGSTRMVVNDTLGVDSIQSYAPYGEPLESGFGSPFTFTGELVDANDLLYLRARYYSPALGVFTALDPIEQVNRYQYVSSNPIRYTDPTGLLKSQQVYANDTYPGRARYSCHCGWVDWSHLVSAEELINNVYRAQEMSYETPYAYYGIRFEMMSKQSFKVFEAGPEVDDIAILPAAFLRNHDLLEIALGIFKAGSEWFEHKQGVYFLGLPSLAGDITGIDELGGLEISGFSEEDLVSDLIGFYMSYTGIPMSEIEKMCDMFSRQESIKVWEQTYGSDKNNPYSNQVISMATTGDGWQSWYPRLLTLLDCNQQPIIDNSQAGQCNNQQRQFPSELASLAQAGIYPTDNILAGDISAGDIGDTWWWQDVNPMYPGMGGTGLPSDVMQVAIQPNLWAIVAMNWDDPTSSLP